MTQVRRTIAFAMVPEAVLYAKVSANAVRLWAILARHADTEWQCYPSRNRLAELMGVSHDTIGRVKQELVEAGLIEVTPNHDSAGRRTADVIVLLEGVPPAKPGGARRKDASTGRRKDASTYIEAFNESHMNETARVRARDPEAGRYPELKRPAREQRILDGEFGQQH